MKIGDLKRILAQQGYTMRPGKGSHRVWSLPGLRQRPIVLHGSDHDDAHPYQIARVRKARRNHHHS